MDSKLADGVAFVSRIRMITITLLLIIMIAEGVVVYYLKTNANVSDKTIGQLGATARLYKDQLDEYSKGLQECRKLNNDLTQYSQDLNSSNLKCSEELRKLKSQ